MVDLDYPDEWARVEASMAADEVEFEVTIPGEGGETEVFFSDLSHDYVTLNGDYTTWPHERRRRHSSRRCPTSGTSTGAPW